MALKNLTEKKEQVFVTEKDGYLTKIKPKTPLEKQYMYDTFSLYFQVGYRSNIALNIGLTDGTILNIETGKLIFNKRTFITNRQIQTLWED